MFPNTSSLSATTLLKCLAVIYVEGKASPEFTGETDLNLASEPSLTAQIKQTFPNVRKAGITLLNTEPSDVPEFLRKAGGKFYFPKTKPTSPTAPAGPRLTSRAAAAGDGPKNKRTRQVLAKKPAKASNAKASERKPRK